MTVSCVPESVVLKEHTGSPVVNSAYTAVRPAADGGVFAAGLIDDPPADAGEAAAGRIQFTTADAGEIAAGLGLPQSGIRSSISKGMD